MNKSDILSMRFPKLPPEHLEFSST
jgi:hypothetical protein